MSLSRWLPLVLLCVASTGARRHAVPARNLLLITLDTLRADYVGAYVGKEGRTPNLDRLASEGALFETTETAAPLTLPSHTAILTGSFPSATSEVDNGVRSKSASQTIAERLRAKGFTTGAFVSAFVLDSRWGLDRGFDVYDSPFTATHVRRRGDLTTNRALAWVSSVRSRPFFAWIHLYDAHGTPSPQQGAGSVDESEYRKRVLFVDAQVGRIVDALDRFGLRDDTAIVAVADHGEGLGDHGEATHGLLLYEAVTHVPLIIRAPHSGRRGRRIPGLTRTVDIAPTALALVGIDSPHSIDGVDLIASLAGRSVPELDARCATDYPFRRYGWSGLRALRSGRFKTIDAPRPELYDLSADPGERRDLASDRPATTAAMLAALRQTARWRPQDTPFDSADRQALASLGYVSATTPGSPYQNSLPDPKDELRKGRRP
jgi:arylsulfatase A-like enzyme